MALADKSSPPVWESLTDGQLMEMKNVLLKNFDHAAGFHENGDAAKTAALTASAIIQLESFVNSRKPS